ncbi:MAG: hypothetical protein K9N09_08570, partial [Candidatus Cloacimonetes bacterium]|nr:hypothetical protein [Candidatus Cloacimonadota bacterium]MCF7814113.1 hypothetical protein [Candidatus Cloacimonadota bacterium]MCF7868738.1 hypothetical protein [Candidatus Cloacimonadota bacterium]MCF7884112.1 hypothetical protein [Candidatus Cloacimonadota bacterium]
SQPVNSFLNKYFLGTFSPFLEEFVLFFKHLAHYFCGFGCFLPKLGLRQVYFFSYAKDYVIK